MSATSSRAGATSGHPGQPAAVAARDPDLSLIDSRLKQGGRRITIDRDAFWLLLDVTGRA